MNNNKKQSNTTNSFSAQFIEWAQWLLPSPFTIALLLTAVTFLLAWLLTEPQANDREIHIFQIMGFWEKGVWELLAFTMQMMLILVLGHVLALSNAVNRLINRALVLCHNTANAAFIVCLFTILVAFVNWGLGLIFGAIFARKVGEHAAQYNISLNYPLIGAAGYSGLMVWHGGLSGSAPVIIGSEGHFLADKIGVVPLADTVFSSMNLVAWGLLIAILPAVMYYLGSKTNTTKITHLQLNLLNTDALLTKQNIKKDEVAGAEQFDRAKWIAYLFGGIMVLWVGYQGVISLVTGGGLTFLSLNYINFLLFGLGIVLHGSIHNFLKAINTAIVGASGIMIQFPLYAGIMGVMKYSGLIGIFSSFFVQISTAFTFPFFTFLSAGIVNVFVPSGGGQWAVQGPIIVEAAQQLNISLPKCVMALAYGDQLTNMMQPFWALPLLGITGLKAKDILPYTLLLMSLGILIFGFVLFVF